MTNLENKKLGRIISTPNSPSTVEFSFLINKEANVRKGQYVQVELGEGVGIGYVSEIRSENRYYEHPEFLHGIDELKHHFPLEEWEHIIADVKLVGIFDGNGFRRAMYPPMPGNIVESIAENILAKFLGLEHDGISLGKVQHHNLNASLNLTRLLQKHLAILAMSGAGKSYLTTVLIEELLKRRAEQGRLAVVIFDIHGEYKGFLSSSFSQQTIHIDVAKSFRFPLSKTPLSILKELAPSFSSAAQLDILKNAWKKAKEMVKEMGKTMFSFKELEMAVNGVEGDAKSKKVILRAIRELKSLRIFSRAKREPNFQNVLKPASLLILDFSGVEDLRKKQAVVALTLRYLFAMRKKGRVPPFLSIVEEAHNFAKEKAEKNEALSKAIIETIAREGRKFGSCLCLISQRPVNLSTTALSQCNTHIIMRITNPNDLDHIQKSSEGIDANVVKTLPALKTGEAIIVGEAVNAPLFLDVRRAEVKKEESSLPLEQLAVKYEKEKEEEEKQKIEDVEAFI